MTPQDANDSGAVQTAADFVAYLRLLAEDYGNDVLDHRDEQFPSGTWAHWDLGAFLEAWAAYVQAVGVERGQLPQELSWGSLAQQLDAARRYE